MFDKSTWRTNYVRLDGLPQEQRKVIVSVGVFFVGRRHASDVQRFEVLAGSWWELCNIEEREGGRRTCSVFDILFWFEGVTEGETGLCGVRHGFWRSRTCAGSNVVLELRREGDGEEHAMFERRVFDVER